MNVATADRNRVLIMGDNAQSHQLTPELRRAGFQVLQAEASQHGLAQAMNNAPNLVILNAGTSPEDSMGLLSTLRDLVNVPIIMMGPDGEMPLVQSLARGADIYLTPATSPRGFLAYARALLWRHALVNTARGGPLPCDAGGPSQGAA